MNTDKIKEVMADFEYARNAATAAGDDETAKWAEFGRMDCWVALKLLESGEAEAAQHFYSRTKEYEYVMDGTSEEFIERTGIEYQTSPEAE